MRPLCPRCQKKETAYTVKVTEDIWQDVCEDCFVIAKKNNEEANPIEEAI